MYLIIVLLCMLRVVAFQNVTLRNLQTATCTATIPNGVWSGSPPDATSDCGGFFVNNGIMSYGVYTYPARTWSVSCNNGFARFGASSGSCSLSARCIGTQGIHGCDVTFNGGLTWSSGCTYICSCTFTYTFTPATPAPSCVQCVPPPAPNAITPQTVLGAESYTWTCAKGYWATPVTRSCLTATDALGNPQWSLQEINCAACIAPSKPQNGWVSRDPISLDTWYVGCNAGYYSNSNPPDQTRVCSTTTGVLSGVQPSCTVCEPGYYCTGGVRSLCPAGKFGAVSALPSNACSGLCQAGYFCGAGSTSSTQNPCGGVGVYCRAGSGEPTPVSANHYSIPLTAPVNFRTDQALCPTDRACSGGVILPGIDISAECPLGKASTRVDEQLPNADFGPLFTVSTPGYSGALNWTIASITAADAGCVLTPSNISMSSYSGAGRLHVRSTPLEYSRCMNGFTVTYRVARSNDASINASCVVSVTVDQVVRLPIITDCGFRSVNERSIVGTNIGAPLEAVNLNVGTSLLWFINYTTSGNIPISVGMCDGQLRVLRPFIWKDSSEYRVDLVLRNDGSALGIGSRSVTCSTYVNVTMVPLPPLPTVTSFFLPELTAPGVLVGNVMGEDPNNFTFTCRWGQRDVLDAFAITPDCNISVILQVDTIVALKSSFRYVLNMTNGFATSETPISITLLPVARPPTFAPNQQRSIRDDAVLSTQLSPTLVATHIQNLPMVFSLATQDSPFNITSAGMLYLAISGALDYQSRSSYTVPVVVTDSNGMSTSANVLVNIIESNKPPAFTQTSFNFSVNEGTGVGSAVAGVSPIMATDANTNDVLLFAIASSQPAVGALFFSINATTGQIALAEGLSLTNNVIRYDAALSYPLPYTFRLTIRVFDNGSPQLSSTTVAWITIANIPPRIVWSGTNNGNYAVSNNATVGDPIANLQPVTWSAYPSAVLQYSLQTETTTLGDIPFTIDQTSGMIRVANVSFTVDGGEESFGPPRFDMLTKPNYRVNVTVLDTTTSLFVTVPIQISLFDSQGTLLRPYFNPSRVRNSFTFTLSTPEHTAPSTVLTPTGLVATTDDPTQASLLRYRWQSTGGAGHLFVVDPITAIVSMAPNAPRMSYTDPRQYTLVLFVNDTLGRSDTATVVINILDINHPAVFNGFGDANNVTMQPGAPFLVPEDALLTSVIGYVRAYEVDKNPLWAQMNFALVPTPDSVYFEIDGRRGMIYMAQRGWDYWDQPVLHLNVSITDGDVFAAPLTVYVPVVVELQQVNTVRIDSFAVPGGTSAQAGVNVSSSIFATLYTDVDALTASTGGEIMIIGRGFGRTSRRLAAENLPANISQISATYGLNGNEYTASCYIAVPNTVIRCSVPEGEGAGFFWRLSVDSWTTMSLRKTGYLPPSITTVSLLGADPLSADDNIMSTRGMQMLEVVGVNFGRTGVAPSLRYGSRGSMTYLTPNCVVIAPGHTRARCTSREGVGASLGFSITVSGQMSNIFNDSLVKYEAPAVTNVSAPLLTTVGEELDVIVVNGTGFGPATSQNVMLWYSRDATFSGLQPIFEGRRCYVPAAAPHVQLICSSAPGIGSNLRVRVQIGGQTSAVSPPGQSISYIPPTIQQIGGVGAKEASTVGGQQIILQGTEFGPVTPLDGSGMPIAGPFQPLVRYGRYTPGQPLRYTAASCRVAVANGQILCLTAPGTGSELVWQVVVGGQESPVFTDQTTSYSPPIIASYSGDGSADALTSGNQVVRISGSNFGPLGTVIEHAIYGAGTTNGSVFTPSNCTLIVAHTTIDCYTDVGAGRSLSWLLTIDGQQSVNPSTSYGRPVITAFHGIGSTNANTDGGDIVVITGGWFSVDRYLERVTYGPSGTEFIARDCYLSIPHSEITCVLQPGVGRKLFWQVTVGGQASEMSPTATSYMYPSITSFTPQQGTTTGGITVTITGTNFGANYSAAQIFVKINNLGVAAPADADLTAHWAAVYDGEAGLPHVAQWISQLTTLRPTTVTILSRGVHRLTVIVPEGFGPRCEMFVTVNGIPSDITHFTYDAPRINNAAPDRQGVPPGFLRVFLEGVSFCSGKADCGTLFVNNKSVEVRSWSHTSIQFIVADTDMVYGVNALAVVWVAGVPSNPFPFRRPVPNIASLVLQPSYTSMDTVGGQQLQVYGVLDISTEAISIWVGSSGECTNVTRTVSNGKEPTDMDAEFTVSCITPPGVGKSLPIVIRSSVGASRADNSLQFSYASPNVQGITIMTILAGGNVVETPGSLGIPTIGANVSIWGSQFGTAALQQAYGGYAYVIMDNSMVLPVYTHNQTVITTSVPAGDGATHWLQVVVGGQMSNPLPFRYASPHITSLAPASGVTSGGTLITIFGSNFGVTAPSILLNERPCTVLTPFVPHASHAQITCITPPGQNTNHALTVTVNGQASTSAATAMFSYLPPVIERITPSNGPTSGFYDLPTIQQSSFTPTQRTIQYIYGLNFGESGSVAFAPTEESDPISQAIIVPVNAIISRNHTTIALELPPGFGTRLRVVVTAGTQASSDAVFFDYDAPMVLGITRHDRSTSDCQPRQQCFRFDNNTACKVSPAGCYDTVGEYPLRVVGANFGPPAALDTITAITIGGKRCLRDESSTQTHNILICMAPRGIGDRNPVVVRVGTRSSAASPQQQQQGGLPHNETLFAYDPPVIISMSPNTPDALGTQEVTFRGKNMGFEATELRITINDIPCVSAEWVSDSLLRCQPPIDVVGPKTVSIVVANRSEPVLFHHFEEMFVSECKYGFYGLRNETCIRCMRGGVCPGGEQLVDKVVSAAGFWRDNVTVPDDRCAPERLQRVAFGCPVVFACEPSWSCLGENQCAEGYEGNRCMFCLKGQYYRVNGECIKCPENVYVVVIMVLLVLLSAAAFAFWMNKRNVSIALVAIGVDYAQVLSMFAKTRIRWPAYVKEIFSLLSAFNFNIELTAPECMMPEVSYWQKFTFIELLPLSFMAIFGIVFVVKLLYKRLFLNRSRKQLYAHAPMLISTSIIIFRVLYLYMTRTSMDVMNCAPTSPPDGNQYMSGMLDMPCWKAGSMQVYLFPFALTFLVIYTLGIPLALWWHLRRHKVSVIADQLLRAKGVGNDRLTNPKFYEFRKKWSKLYYHFKPDNWYWEMCIFARKALLSFTSLMFRSTPSYQLALALLILFVAYVAHVKFTPYMTHSNKADILTAHSQLALSNNSVHAAAEAELKDAAKSNVKKRSAVNVFQLRTQKHHIAQRAVLAVFDYNTVEGVLLCSAVLTVLAGIMFDSNRFSEDNFSYFQAEYDSLTASVITLIVGTLIYFVCAFILDFTVVLCPARSAALLQKCSYTPGSTRVGSKAKLVTHFDDDADRGKQSEMVVNPFMLQQHAKETAEGSQAYIDPKDVAGIMEPPNASGWSAFQQSYVKMSELLKEAQQQAREGKRRAEANEIVSSPSIRTDSGHSDKRPQRTRRQFTPVNLSDNGTSTTVANPLSAPESTSPRSAANALAAYRSNSKGLLGSESSHRSSARNVLSDEAPRRRLSSRDVLAGETDK